MTTLAHQQNHNKFNILVGIIAFLAIVAFFALSTYRSPAYTVTAIKPIPQIQYQPHAVEKHGSDALAIRKCLNDKGGAEEIWRSFDKKTFIYGAICQMVVGDLWPLCGIRLIACDMKVPLSSRVMEQREPSSNISGSLALGSMVHIPGSLGQTRCSKSYRLQFAGWSRLSYVGCSLGAD